MRHRAAFLYADDGLVGLTEPVWLQGEFDTLYSFFDRAGLCKNTIKMIGMICCPSWAVGIQLEVSYKWRMKG